MCVIKFLTKMVFLLLRNKKILLDSEALMCYRIRRNGELCRNFLILKISKIWMQ